MIIVKSLNFDGFCEGGRLFVLLLIFKSLLLCFNFIIEDDIYGNKLRNKGNCI